MRLTANMSLRTTLDDLSNSLSRLKESQRRLATGKAHDRMSDAPKVASDVMFLRGSIQRHDQMTRTAEHTRSRLALVDSTLVSVSDTMIRAKEIAVRASNTGVGGPAQAASLAQELRLLRDEVIGQANASYLGRSLFNGTAVGAAYAADGTYQGDRIVDTRTVADGVTVAANITGIQVFGDAADPNGDLFTVLGAMADAIEAGDNVAIGEQHANLEVATDRLGSAVAEVGRRVAQLDKIAHDGAIRREHLVGRLSEVEDVDLADAVLDMKAHETAHQAALAAAAHAMPPSLAEYLR